MKEENGIKKAGDLAWNNSIFMMVSIIAVSLFIGTAVQPAILGSTTGITLESTTREEDYFPCDCEETDQNTGGCDTCIKAAVHAIKFMRTHVQDYVKYLKTQGVYYVWTLDAISVVIEGLVLGIKDSGFTIDLDYTDLHDMVTFFVSKLCGPQVYLLTRFVARLGAISIGIAWYLLSFCINTQTIVPIE